MKCVHFYGGGFKTMYYFNFAKTLIEDPIMPEYYSGTSSGILAAIICLALSTIDDLSTRKILLTESMKIIERDIVKATKPIHLNFNKCTTSVDVVIQICKYIQPNIEKYNNHLNINITRPFSIYTCGLLHQSICWKSWDDLRLDMYASSSIPGIQDYKFRKDNSGFLSVDGCFCGENLPRLWDNNMQYTIVSCNHYSTADIKPEKDNAPKWYHIICNPDRKTLKSWWNI